MWLQWKSFLWDIMMFSASTYSFLLKMLQKYVWRHNLTLLFNDILLLLDKLDLKDKISKITSKNKYCLGKGKCKILVPLVETLSSWKKFRCVLQCRKRFYLRNKKKPNKFKLTSLICHACSFRSSRLSWLFFLTSGKEML